MSVSAVAVNAAQVDVAAFTAGLAARVGVRATDVADVDSGYLAQEAASITALATVVKHPLSPPSYQVGEQGRGAYLYQGRDATVVLNKDGQVVTAWPNNHHGWRH